MLLLNYPKYGRGYIKGLQCDVCKVDNINRTVKEAMLEAQGKCTCPKDLPYCICNYKSYGNIITKKPIEATKEEKDMNPRSNSAKLRVFEKQEKTNINNQIKYSNK